MTKKHTYLVLILIGVAATAIIYFKVKSEAIVSIRNYFKIFKGNETITFVSDKNDTFKINLTGYKNKIVEHKGKMYEQFSLSYEHGFDREKRSDYLYIITAGEKTDFWGMYLDGVRGYYFRGAIPFTTINQVTPEVLKIGDKLYDDVIKVNYDMSNENGKEGLRINYVYFSKKFGIVQFVTNSNEVYLLKSINAKIN